MKNDEETEKELFYRVMPVSVVLEHTKKKMKQQPNEQKDYLPILLTVFGLISGACGIFLGLML